MYAHLQRQIGLALGVFASASASALALAVPTAQAQTPLAHTASAAQIRNLQTEGVDTIIVKYKPALSPQARTRLRASAGVRYLAATSLANTETDRVRPGDLAQALKALTTAPGVVYAEANASVTSTAATNPPNNPDFGEQWALANTGYFVGDTPGDDVGALSAWSESKGAGVTVAVVDTGFDFSAPGLAGQSVGGYNFVDPGTLPQDGNGHGTHVSGIIAAIQGNGIGVSGLAPDAKIMPLQAMDASGSGSYANVAAAFNYAGAAGVRIVSASLGGTVPSQTMTDAITSHPNTLYVVAAGNAGTNNDNASTPFYPCDIAAANLICVGASDASDNPASFSDYGRNSVSLFAPGVDILSTWLSDTTDLGCSVAIPCATTAYESGTSMATPMVSATLALMLSANPNLTSAQLKADLLATVTPVSALASLSVSGGVLNAGAAVNAVTPAAAPAVTITSAPSTSTNTSATIAFTTSGLVYATTCTLDGVAVACGSTSAALTNLSVGTHTFVVAINGPGGAATTTTTFTVSAPAVAPTPTPTQVVTPVPTPSKTTTSPTTALLSWSRTRLTVTGSCRTRSCNATLSSALNSKAEVVITLTQTVRGKTHVIASASENASAGANGYALSLLLRGRAAGNYQLSAVAVAGTQRSSTFRASVRVRA